VTGQTTDAVPETAEKDGIVRRVRGLEVPLPLQRGGPVMTTPHVVADRPALIRRGEWLAWFTIGWNAIEGIAGIVAGLAAGSIALVGFGIDSYVEVFAGSVILWRLAKERHGREVSDAAERRAVRLIAVTFLLLAAGVGLESVRKLVVGAEPDESLFGIGLAVVSLIVMPLLARAKRRVGEQLGSRAVTADATETTLCVWLSGILLVGLGLNALFGWWWADPLAGLCIVYVAGREGVEHWGAEELDDCCS
jgi:divalent metal cation (Fe/Co/Zn/Cd) transporter